MDPRLHSWWCPSSFFFKSPQPVLLPNFLPDVTYFSLNMEYCRVHGWCCNNLVHPLDVQVPFSRWCEVSWQTMYCRVCRVLRFSPRYFSYMEWPIYTLTFLCVLTFFCFHSPSAISLSRVHKGPAGIVTDFNSFVHFVVFHDLVLLFNYFVVLSFHLGKYEFWWTGWWDW